MDDKELEKKEVAFRSEEVQEVMGRVSPWILRWGITVLFCVVTALLIGSYLFKYPDTIQAEITLSMDDPPAYVQARIAGRVEKLFVKNGAKVKKGTALGIIQNAACTEDILLLKDKIQKWAGAEYSLTSGKVLFADLRLQLGECQAAYGSFLTALTDYIRFNDQKFNKR